MSKLIYIKDRTPKTPSHLRNILHKTEIALIKILFIELELKYNYKIEIHTFSKTSSNLPKYWIIIKFFLVDDPRKTFTLMTLYCSDNNFPLKVQTNYLYDELIEISDENIFLEIIQNLSLECFLEMNSYLEYNRELLDLNTVQEEELLIFAPRAVAYKAFKKKDPRIISNMNYYDKSRKWKRWTLEEKKIIIENIPFYREEINENKELIKKSSLNFASTLLNKNKSIFENRAVSALSNRLAYFDELLAGVESNYTKTDQIYFGKMKRLDGSTEKNPARTWR